MFSFKKLNIYFVSPKQKQQLILDYYKLNIINVKNYNLNNLNAYNIILYNNKKHITQISIEIIKKLVDMCLLNLYLPNFWANFGLNFSLSLFILVNVCARNPIPSHNLVHSLKILIQMINCVVFDI